jgi:GNAT superfamily N-acetyltransferase
MIDGYRLSDEGLDVDLVHRWLSEDSYWASGRARETVARSLRHSYCLGVFSDEGRQVGLARTVTDWATFAWIADVYIDRAHRGRGLGHWVVGELRDRLEGAGIPRLILATVDAHGVYEALGFGPLAHPERWMEIDKR